MLFDMVLITVLLSRT